MKCCLRYLLVITAAAAIYLALNTAAVAGDQCPRAHERLAGEMMRVKDGDTIIVMLKTSVCGRVIRTLRLADGVDTPEYSQPYGTRARLGAQALTQGKKLIIELTGRRTYNRLLARVWLPDGRRLGRVLVDAGLAWVDPRYAKRGPGIEMIRRMEAARADRRGLWSQPAPIAPWKWRKGER